MILRSRQQALDLLGEVDCSGSHEMLKPYLADMGLESRLSIEELIDCGCGVDTVAQFLIMATDCGFLTMDDVRAYALRPRQLDI